METTFVAVTAPPAVTLIAPLLLLTLVRVTASFSAKVMAPAALVVAVIFDTSVIQRDRTGRTGIRSIGRDVHRSHITVRRQ